MLVPSDTNRTSDIYVRDRLSQRTVRASLNGVEQEVRGGRTGGESMSHDGSAVAFESFASGFVPGDVDDGNTDIYGRFGNDPAVRK